MRRDLRVASADLAPQGGETAPLDEAALSIGGPGGYVTHALRAHPRLRADFERWHAAVLRISEARRLPEPMLSYGYYVQSVETRVGPQRHRLSFRQSFPWPTRLIAGADARSIRARAMQRIFEARATALRAAVEERYWRLWSIRHIRSIKEEQAQILREMAAGVRGRIEAGQGTLADLQQVEVARSRLDDAIRSLTEGERSAQAALIEAIGAPQGISTPTTSEAPPLSLPMEPEAALRSAALAHPRIEAHALRTEASEAEAQSIEAMRLPSFTLGVDWIETGEAAMPGVQGSGTDPVIVSLGVRLPVWQDSYDQSQRAAQAEGAAHRADRRAAENAAAAGVSIALSRIRDSRRQALLHRDTLLPQALSSYESVLGAYAVGRSSVAALLLAQRDLLELREGQVRAETLHAQAWAALLALVGREVEATPAGSEDSSAPEPESESNSEFDEETPLSPEPEESEEML